LLSSKGCHIGWLSFVNAMTKRDAVLDPDVVLRADRGGVPQNASKEARGAAAVAKQSLFFSRLASAERIVRPALVNGAAGVVAFEHGRPHSVMGFTVRGGKIVEIYVLADPARLDQLDLAVLKD